jgi:D-threonate/D-erythronate kinase
MPVPPRFWVIADDLTGALDTAAPFASRGWRTAVVPWPARPGTRGALGPVLSRAVSGAVGASDVIVVDTASRHVAAREAARRVRAVVDASRPGGRLRRGAAPGYYKKIDSTLRGNVAAELAAFRAAVGVACLPLAPAFPALGRVTRRGAVWVDGRPLSASAAARDAIGPAASGDLAALAPRGALEVLDAETDADLRRIARTLAREGRLGALAGSGGLAGAIAATARPGRGAAVAARVVPRPVPRLGPHDFPRLGPHAERVLVVSGSAHPAARVQMQRLVAGGALGLVAPIDAATTDRDRRVTAGVAAATLAAGRPVALVCPPLAAGARVSTRAAHLAATRLAALVRAVLAEASIDALVTIGGDTAGAIVDAMGWAPLTVAGALEPGVALVDLGPPRRRSPRRPGPRRPAPPRWLITKSGGFGDPLTVRRLVRRLTAGARSRRPSTPR